MCRSNTNLLKSYWRPSWEAVNHSQQANFWSTSLSTCCVFWSNLFFRAFKNSFWKKYIHSRSLNVATKLTSVYFFAKSPLKSSNDLLKTLCTWLIIGIFSIYHALIAIKNRIQAPWMTLALLFQHLDLKASVFVLLYQSREGWAKQCSSVQQFSTIQSRVLYFVWTGHRVISTQ